VLRDAAARVASGWPHPVEGSIQRRADGVAVALSWQDGDLQRAVVAWAPAAGDVRLTGVVGPPGFAPTRRPLAAVPAPLDADRLTLALRLAMETVATWTPAEQPA